MCGSGSVLGIRVRKSWIRFQYGSGSTTQVLLSRRGNGSTNKQFSDQWHCSIPDKSCCFTHYSKLYRSGWSEKNEAFTIAWIAPGIGKVNPVQVLIHANQGHNRQWLWGGLHLNPTLARAEPALNGWLKRPLLRLHKTVSNQCFKSGSSIFPRIWSYMFQI